MLRNKAVIIVVGILFFMVAAYNLNFFLKKKPSVSQKQPAMPAGSALIPDTSSVPIPASTLQVPRDKETWKRDPFQYKAGERSPGKQTDQKKPIPGEVILQGITVRDGKYYAFVNGEIVEEGDRLEGLTIVRISRYSVFVKDVSGTREINIYDGIFDKEK